MKGDILGAQGKPAEAKAAYEAALAKLDLATKGNANARAHGAYRELLQTKLDLLGGTH
jgi:predicted negative regulator of RcsB-dependent stress response